MPSSVAKRFLLLYGSQTGQAKAISEEIAEKAGQHDLHADIHCLSLTEKKFFLEREKCVVIVTSTTGDGEPPDTALKFVRRLKKMLPDDHLSHLNYALLGLGDSNYTNFCNCGKSLDKRLQDLGAKRLYESGWADDAVGLEVAVEPWMDGLWPALKRFLKLPDAERGGGDAESINVNTAVISNGDSTLTGSAVIQTEKMSSTLDTQSDISKNSTIPILTNGNNHEKSNSADSSHITDIDQSDCNNSSNVVSNSSSANNSDSLQKAVNETTSNGTDSTLETNGLTVSVPLLSESTLTVPLLPPPFLKTELLREKKIDICDLPRQNGCDFPSSATQVTMATVSNMKTLTSDTAVKKAMCVELDISGSDIKYQPGDSFSVICPNDPSEVEALLKRLCLWSDADTCVQISVLETTKKRNASVPKFVPEVSSYRHIFTTCLDIREPPKKALLRVLVEYTSSPEEIRRLQELCSKQGNEDYARFIREPSLSILDILNNFPTCHPPVDRLIEHLPRLQPRPYSVCSSPLTSPEKLSFVFNVVEIEADNGRTYYRKGLCTGWLEGMSHSTEKGDQIEKSTETNIEQGLEEMKLNDIKIPVYGRTNQSFHMPDDVTVPVILIGPGTGVAPFIGFLDHRSCQRQAQPGTEFGEVWLFFGCRHEDRDYLFREKLANHLSTSTLTKLHVSFSRDEHQPAGSPRYVQDSLRSHGREIVTLIEDKNAVIYVCGDAKNMAKDVNQAFIDVFSQCKGITSEEARKIIMMLRLNRKYKEDVWT